MPFFNLLILTNHNVGVEGSKRGQQWKKWLTYEPERSNPACDVNCDGGDGRHLGRPETNDASASADAQGCG
eukprot:scaffold73285_cov49-Cyclotella_meneghiniana.AAC.2